MLGISRIALWTVLLTWLPCSAQTLGTFTLHNTSSTQASSVYKRVGVAFEAGDIPAGNQLGVRVAGGADVDGAMLNVKTYPDGSLWCGTLAMHDATTIPAGGSRTYEVYNKSGSQSSSSWDPWSWIASHPNDLEVRITNHSGGYYGARSNETFSLKTASLVSARREVSDDTSVLTRILVWQKVAGDEHLNAMFYVDFWLNAAGTAPVAFEAAPVMTQHWWTNDPFGVTEIKEQRTYDADVRYGTTVLDTYTGLAHAYHCRWAALRTDDDAEHANPHWIDLGSASMPTLMLEYHFDLQSKLVHAGAIPPYPVTPVTTGPDSYPASYTPLGTNGHRFGISTAGKYPAAGMLCDQDIMAWQYQNEYWWRKARVAAQAGLSLFSHYRDPRLVNGEPSAGLIPNLLSQMSQGTYPGLAAPEIATINRNLDAPSVYPCDIPYPSTSTDIYGKVCGESGAFCGFDSAHAVEYSYFMAFAEGHAYLADAVRSAWDLPTRHLNWKLATHDFYLFWANSARGQDMGIPLTRWGQIFPVHSQARSARPFMALAKAYMVTPDDDRHIPYFQDQMEYYSDYFDQAYAYYPAAQKAKGTFFGPSPSRGKTPTWMHNFSGMSSYMAWNIGDKAGLAVSGLKMAGEQSALLVINMMKYHPGVLKSPNHSISADSEDRTFQPPEKNFALHNAEVISSRVELPIDIKCDSPLTNDDEVMFVEYTETGSLTNIPPQVSYYQILYVRDISGLTSFKVAATPGGPALTLDETTKCAVGLMRQSTVNQVTWDYYYSSGWDVDYVDQNYHLFQVAQFFDHPEIDSALISKGETFMTNRPEPDYPQYVLDPGAFAVSVLGDLDNDGDVDVDDLTALVAALSGPNVVTSNADADLDDDLDCDLHDYVLFAGEVN